LPKNPSERKPRPDQPPGFAAFALEPSLALIEQRQWFRHRHLLERALANGPCQPRFEFIELQE
jgi:hypothetical protein